MEKDITITPNLAELELQFEYVNSLIEQHRSSAIRMDMDEALDRAVDAKKFASTRVKPYWVKILFDGTVESGTGIVEPLYPDGHQGIANWTEEELTELTRKANARGLTMHVHVMGNKVFSM
jgi:predicted amidohydrolase YtcJ